MFCEVVLKHAKLAASAAGISEGLPVCIGLRCDSTRIVLQNIAVKCGGVSCEVVLKPSSTVPACLVSLAVRVCRVSFHSNRAAERAARLAAVGMRTVVLLDHERC